MKLLFLILTFFQFTIAKASNLNFNYTYSHVEREFNLELYELSKIFEEKSFQRLSAYPSGNIPFVYADEIMSSPNHKGLIFIKMNLIAPENLQYEVMEGPNFFLYHTKNASICFYNFSKTEVKQLTDSLKPSLFSHFKIQNILIVNVQADEVHCQNSLALPTNERITYVGLISGKLTHDLLIKKLGECGVNALKVMYSKIDSTKDFFIKMKDNPSKLWEEMKENYFKLKEMITSLSLELEKFYAAFSNITLEDQYTIACKLIGESIPGLVLSATGVGVSIGVAKIMGGLLPKMQKLRVLLNEKRYLSTSEAISCAL